MVHSKDDLAKAKEAANQKPWVRLCLGGLSFVALFHFAISLFMWGHLVYIIYAIGIESEIDWMKQVYQPFSLCLVLFWGFAGALFATVKGKKSAKVILASMLVLSLCLFIYDVQMSHAQIHKFGPPGTNHFFATWWFYSAGPPLPNWIMHYH